MSNLLFRYVIRKKLPLTKIKRPLKGQRFVDILAPKANVIKNHQNCVKLIEDFLQTGSVQNCEHPLMDKEDSVSLLFRFHKEGSKIGVSLVSNAMSLCASKRVFNVGIQVHCLVIVNGFFSNVYIGSSLISFYGNFGGIVDAYQVFDEMSVRNVVSWSALLNGFAKENELGMCLKLYKGMMGLGLKVSEFVFTSLLSVCMGSGCFGYGRSIHCQIIVMVRVQAYSLQLQSPTVCSPEAYTT